jgi:hypothetical protein
VNLQACGGMEKKCWFVAYLYHINSIMVTSPSILHQNSREKSRLHSTCIHTTLLRPISLRESCKGGSKRSLSQKGHVTVSDRYEFCPNLDLCTALAVWCPWEVAEKNNLEPLEKNRLFV